MDTELKLTRALKDLLKLSGSEPLTFGELLLKLGLQGQVVFLLFLVSPMLQPIPLPGLSSILSFMAVIIGFQILNNKPAWLPEKYRHRVIPAQKLEKWVINTIQILEKVKKFIHPRKRLRGDLLQIRKGVTVFILMASLLLALPLPIPFSNFFPSVTIFLFGLGLLEDDGLLYICGLVFFVISVFYIGSILHLPFHLIK